MEVSLLLEEARLAFGRQQKSWSWRARGAAGFPGRLHSLIPRKEQRARTHSCTFPLMFEHDLRIIE